MTRQGFGEGKVGMSDGSMKRLPETRPLNANEVDNKRADKQVSGQSKQFP